MKNGGHRIIMDLSRPFGDSVDDYINKEAYSFSFCKFDEAIKLVTLASPGTALAEEDNKHAFRLIPVRPADWHLLGYVVHGLFFSILSCRLVLKRFPFFYGFAGF